MSAQNEPLAPSPGTAASAGGTIRYRADIDGLRALAIVPILLLHCGVWQVRGGFVGVDIFFVISGYLITGILTRDIAHGHFSILRFYRHRIVRILPALFTMLVLVTVAGCVLLLPNQIRDLGRSVAATSVFASNFYFYATSDYFAASSDMKPLVHTWSLAVEEQFYLLYPFLLLAMRHWPRQRQSVLIGGLAILSFAVGWVLAYANPSAGFYFLPTRIWELSIGALVALGALPNIPDARVRAVLCLCAVGAIVLSALVIGIRWPFPVPYALPAAAGAAILIGYGQSGPTARLLSLWPLRAIGWLSYSLYLWHRPIISYYQLVHGSTVGPDGVVLLLAASFAAAILSYRLIERPAIRRWRTGQTLRPHAIAVAALAAGVAAGLMVTAQADTLRPLSPPLARIASYIGFDQTPAGRRQFSLDRCFSIPTHADADLACLRLSPTRRNVVLMGDSHAAHYSEALRAALPDAHLVQVTAAGCLPLIHGPGLVGCRYTLDHAFRDIDFGHVDTAILSARWLAFAPAQLVETIHWLQQRGVHVVVIGPTVEYDADLPSLLVRMAQGGDPGLADRLRLRDRLALDPVIAKVAQSAGASYVSEIALECPHDRCALQTTDRAPFHFDHSHLTPSAARQIVAAIIATGVLSAPRR